MSIKILGWMAAVLLATPGVSVWATPPVSPEEDLVTLYGSGKVEEARAGFRKLAEERSSDIERLLAEPSVSEFRFTQTAWQIAALAETVVIWEAAEILLQHRGGVTPPEVYAEVGERIARVDQQMERLAQKRQWTAWSKRENELGFERAQESLQKNLLKTVAFLRNGGAPEKRQAILQRTVRRGGGPATLDEFDQQNPDLLKLFRIVVGPSGTGTAAQLEDDQLLARLAKVLPGKPAQVTPEITGMINQAAETKRLDAAVLLIRALAFNHSTSGYNESMSLVGHLPAATNLQRYYGVSVLPLLMYTGVTTDEEWLQRRIALVLRELYKPGEVGKVRAVFSLDHATSPAARQLKEFLDANELHVELYNPGLESLKELVTRLEQLEEQSERDKSEVKEPDELKPPEE